MRPDEEAALAGPAKTSTSDRPERRRSGQRLLQRSPLAVDPNADRHDRRNDRHDQNPEKHRVLNQRSAFLVLAESAHKLRHSRHLDFPSLPNRIITPVPRAPRRAWSGYVARESALVQRTPT